MRYMKLWLAFFQQWLKTLLAYRGDFTIGLMSTVSLQSAALLTLWVVMQQVPTLGGWSFDELLFLYGLLALSKAFSDMFAATLMQFGRAHIGYGKMDSLLLKPANPLFLVLVERFSFDAIGDMLVGLILVGKALMVLQPAFGPLEWLLLPVAVLSGGAIFSALKLFGAASAFWIMDGFPVNYAIQKTHEMAKYPLSIYGKGVGVLFTWLLPFGFASFYPAEYLLGKAPGQTAWLAPLVVVILLAVGYRFWSVGLSRYAGAGS